MNFENLNIGFHFFFLIISFLLTRFHKDKKSIAMSSIKCLNFKFLCYKTKHKKINLLIE